MKVLPPSVRDALATRWDLDPARLTFLGGGEDWSDGTLFTAPTPGGDRVIKVFDFSLDDTGATTRVEDRIRLVRDFGARGCRIVTPLPDRDGRLFSTLDQGDRRFLAFTYAKVPGRAVTEKDRSTRSGGFYRAVGAELGRLHAAWEARGDVPEPRGTSVVSTELKGWRDEMGFFRSWCRDDEVGRAWERVQAALEGEPVLPSTYGFVHNDAHAWNFLFDPEAVPDGGEGEPALTVIDFDVANFHWFLGDCAVALYSFGIMGTGGIESGKAPPTGFLPWSQDLFWEGYRRYRAVPDLSRLDLFLQYRRCLLFMPMQEQTDKNPAWKARWKARIADEDRRLFG